ncbi:UPF0489 family protein [Candidatus Omnitrophota bacterium]
MKNVFLVEDHDEVLKIWRRHKVLGLDLVHLDAHIDFVVYPARPIEKVVSEARSIKELKAKLEHSLNFLHYEKDFNKQTNIGNYIYPAMEEGIVNNFYWVIPGGAKEFKKSRKIIKNTLKRLTRPQNNGKVILKESSNDSISMRCLGRNFVVCTLDSLPVLGRDVLLDIDTDFLVIDSLLSAENTRNISKRRVWISPKDLTSILKKKIKSPKITTIAYSVNGGFTPMKYRYLGDEVAACFSHSKFKGRLAISHRAAKYFNLFESTGSKAYYQKAARLNPAYRSQDNNYGALYLSLRKFSLAQKEFFRILRVDKNNPGALSGLGTIALGRRELKKAKNLLGSALNYCGNNGAFKKVKPQVLFNLAKAEFNSGDFKSAKERLLSYRRRVPLDPEGYYLLGRIFEKEGEFSQAAIFYKDTLRLGWGTLEPLIGLLRVSRKIADKDEMIKYVRIHYKFFKRRLNRLNKLHLKQEGKSRLISLKKKMLILEKQLKGGKY